MFFWLKNVTKFGETSPLFLDTYLCGRFGHMAKTGGKKKKKHHNKNTERSTVEGGSPPEPVAIKAKNKSIVS